MGPVKKNTVLGLAVIMSAVPLSAQLAFAQGGASETAASASDRSGVVVELGTIRSVAEAGRSSGLLSTELPSTVDVIGGAQIETENVDFAVGLMRKLPGVYFGDHNNGVVPGTFGMRGYDTNNPPPVTLVVDGIPHHFDPRGRAEFQPFFALEIERMELVKGTNDPRYGIGNMAGTLNLATKRNWDITQVRLLAGEYNTMDAQMFTGHKSGNVSQDYFIGLRRTDGYRENSDLIKGAASGKWFYHSDDGRLSTGVIARTFSLDANAGGYTSIEEARANPAFSPEFSASDGGEQRSNHVSLHVDYALSSSVDLWFKAFTQDQDKVRWARFSLAGAQQERLNDDRATGILTGLSHNNSNIPGFEHVRFNLGFDYTTYSNIEQRYATVNRVRGNILRDWDYDWDSWGAYVQADGDVNDWLKLVAAIRTDSVTGDFTNVIAGQSSTMDNMKNIVQPKIGAIITPYEGYSIFANWGRTFTLPANPELFGQDGAGNLIPGLGAGDNDGWEIGVTASPIDQVVFRASYWQIDTGNELIHAGGTTINAGATDRKGFDISVVAKVHPWVDIWGSYANVEAKYVNPAPGLEDREGEVLSMVPEYTAKIGIDVDHPSGATMSLWMDMVDDYYPDTVTIAERSRGKLGGYEVAHLALGYKVSPTLTLGVDIRNVFDQEYFGWAWDYDVGIMPGQPRSYYGWMRYEFQ